MTQISEIKKRLVAGDNFVIKEKGNSLYSLLKSDIPNLYLVCFGSTKTPALNMYACIRDSSIHRIDLSNPEAASVMDLYFQEIKFV